jgi:hypothetical protein
MKITRILLSISILCLIGAILTPILGIHNTENAWIFMGFFLGTIGFANWAGAITENDKWNRGICEKTGEAWEFKSSDMLSDCSVVYSFESGDEFYLSQYIEHEIMIRQYKGKKKIV